MNKLSSEEKQYDFIVVGAGAAGSVLAAELSASGAQVLVIESGDPTTRRPSQTRASGFTMSAGRSTTTCPSTRRRD
jgi:choline dehydrogenase-like flavoprotein